MEDFNLVLQNLISKDLSGLHTELLSDNLKIEFDKTADVYAKNKNFRNAIKAYAITGNKEKLISTGLKCLEENLPYDAFLSFFYADKPDYLNKIGFILLKIPDVHTSLEAFRKGGNNEMISFIESNF